MNEADLKKLNEGGIDAKEALGRLNGSEKFFLKVVKKFLNDNNFEDYIKYLSEGDLENAERSLHALKGVAGNLGITDVYKLSAEIDTGLKEGKTPDPDKNETLRLAYEKAIEAIGNLEDA